MTDESWSDFCQAIQAAGDHVANLADGDDRDRAEGYRLVTRALRYLLLRNMECDDPDFPRFFQAIDETMKLMGDSPDYLYLMAGIRGDRDYRITGRRGSAEILALSTYGPGPAGSSCTGELVLSDTLTAPDAPIDVIVSAQRQPGAWLPMAPHSTFLQVRNIFPDSHKSDPALVRIDRLGGPPYPAPFDMAQASAKLGATAAQLSAMTGRLAGFQNQLIERVGVNMFDHDQTMWQASGAAPTTHYIQGVYDLGLDEALIVESDVPPCRYFSFQLNSRWMESLDYSRRRIYLNNHSAMIGPDGRLRIIVAARDPGLPNWIATEGRERECMQWKWNEPARLPSPLVRRVRMGDLHATLQERPSLS